MGAEYGARLIETLAPLGLSAVDSLSAAELQAIGAELDALAAELEEIEREMLLSTAEGWGLDAVEEYLGRHPESGTLAQRRDSLAALLRVGGTSATVQGINDTLSGCGLVARARDSSTVSHVEVFFPDVAGQPENFEQIKTIINQILPCHLEVIYCFWNITWNEMEQKFATWQSIEDLYFSFEGLEKYVR